MITSTMLYRIVKIIMTPALRLFYRRIYVTGIEMIPEKGPVILLANHTSAVMDAALMGILLSRPVYFFTRGDVFINKRVSWLLSLLRMIPVHNHDKGRKTLYDNEDSFLKASKILAAGGILLFFPEGNSRVKRNLTPLRKGVFRLAFQAAGQHNFEQEISLIPTGIGYDHPTASFRDVMVHFGKPMYLSSYRTAYEENPNATLLQMAKEGFAGMERQLLHINQENNYHLAEMLLTIRHNNYHFFTRGWLQATTQKFNGEKQLCNRINKLDAEQRNALERQANEYFRELKRYGLADRTLSPSFLFGTNKKFLLFYGYPLYILSYLLSALPLLVAQRITRKTAQRIDYYSWILVSTSTFLYIGWLLLLLAGFSFIGWQYAGGIMFASLLTLPFLLSYKRLQKDFSQSRKRRELAKVNPGLVKEMIAIRQQLSKEPNLQA